MLYALIYAAKEAAGELFNGVCAALCIAVPLAACAAVDYLVPEQTETENSLPPTYNGD